MPAFAAPLATSAARTGPATGSAGIAGTICALLFFSTTINYIDRKSLRVLKTMLEQQMNWSEADYGWIQFAFTSAYAAFPSIIGRFIDTFGVKTGLARRAGAVVADVDGSRPRATA